MGRIEKNVISRVLENFFPTVPDLLIQDFEAWIMETPSEQFDFRRFRSFFTRQTESELWVTSLPLCSIVASALSALDPEDSGQVSSLALLPKDNLQAVCRGIGEGIAKMLHNAVESLCSSLTGKNDGVTGDVCSKVGLESRFLVGEDISVGVEDFFDDSDSEGKYFIAVVEILKIPKSSYALPGLFVPRLLRRVVCSCALNFRLIATEKFTAALNHSHIAELRCHLCAHISCFCRRQAFRISVEPCCRPWSASTQLTSNFLPAKIASKFVLLMSGARSLGQHPKPRARAQLVFPDSCGGYRIGECWWRRSRS